MHFIVDFDDTLVHTTRDLQDQPSRIDYLMLVPGALRFLRAHQGSMTLLSAGDLDFQREKIEKVGIGEYVRNEVFVLAPEEKAHALRIIVQGLPVPRTDVIVIGDRVDLELRTAKRLGCRAIRMRLPDGKYSALEPRCKDEEPDYTVSNFDEVLALPLAAHVS